MQSPLWIRIAYSFFESADDAGLDGLLNPTDLSSDIPTGFVTFILEPARDA